MLAGCFADIGPKLRLLLLRHLHLAHRPLRGIRRPYVHNSLHINNMCIDQLALTQIMLDELLKECVVVGMYGKGESPGGASGGKGGKGDEYENQDVGEAWRFEETDRN